MLFLYILSRRFAFIADCRVNFFNLWNQFFTSLSEQKKNWKETCLIEWLISMAYQPVKDYFILRYQGIIFIVRSCLFCCVFLRGLFVFFVFLRRVLSNTNNFQTDQFDPLILQALWVRVDQGVMAMRGYSTLPISPEIFKQSCRQVGLLNTPNELLQRGKTPPQRVSWDMTQSNLMVRLL